MLLDSNAQLEIGKVGVGKTNVIRPVAHSLEIVDTMQEHSRDIAYVNVISFEMRLEQHNCAIIHRTIDEIVHEQVNTHPRRHPEDSGKPKADAVAAIERCFFGFNFSAAVKRDRPERSVFG